VYGCRGCAAEIPLELWERLWSVVEVEVDEIHDRAFEYGLNVRRHVLHDLGAPSSPFFICWLTRVARAPNEAELTVYNLIEGDLGVVRRCVIRVWVRMIH
jgi:hypothetical protein